MSKAGQSVEPELRDVRKPTGRGRELEPVVLELGAWRFKTRDEQIITPDSLTIDLRSAFRANVVASLPPHHSADTVSCIDLNPVTRRRTAST